MDLSLACARLFTLMNVMVFMTTMIHSSSIINCKSFWWYFCAWTVTIALKLPWPGRQRSSRTSYKYQLRRYVGKAKGCSLRTHNFMQIIVRFARGIRIFIGRRVGGTDRALVGWRSWIIASLPFNYNKGCSTFLTKGQRCCIEISDDKCTLHGTPCILVTHRGLPHSQHHPSPSNAYIVQQIGCHRNLKGATPFVVKCHQHCDP